MTGKSDLDAQVVLVPGLLSDGRVWKSVEDALPDGQCYLADVKQDATIQAGLVYRMGTVGITPALMSNQFLGGPKCPV